MMKNKIIKKLQNMERETMIFIAVIFFCIIGVCAFLGVYFNAYQNPYLEKSVIDLSPNWEYRVGNDTTALQKLANLGSGPKIDPNETLFLYKTLDTSLPEAAILIRANHQHVNVYLDDKPLFVDTMNSESENPGMALHFLLLPTDYLGKTLRVELTSPYYQYAGLTGHIYMGSIPSLEAFTISHSMRSVIMMSMCLLIGLMIIGLTLLQALKGSLHKGQLAIGVFAVILALYYVCVDYIVFQFFTPTMMSILSLGFYYLLPLPLMLFFYFFFQHYRKWMIPAIILHSAFVIIAFVLQGLNLVQLPKLLDYNNILWAGFLYTVVLTFLEAFKKNRLMIIAAPFMVFTYISIAYNFWTFYGRSGTVPYSYRDSYFLLILSVLIFSIQQFFSQYYQQQRNSELLQLQNRLAKESWEEAKFHLLQVGSLKHEVVRHYTAMQALMESGLYEQAQNYLTECVGQAVIVTEVVHHENFLINAVVGRLSQRANEMGVKLELNLKSCHVGITDPDLYCLLSNILENALEACETVPPGIERFIHLTVARKEPYLYITCMNSKYGKTIYVDENFQSTKADFAKHGYGLRTVQSIVNRYNGILDTDYNETTFTITLALKDRNDKYQ